LRTGEPVPTGAGQGAKVRTRSAAGARGEFDALQLAARRQRFGGTLDARTLPRAAERLAGDGVVPLVWRIEGTRDAAGRPALEVALEGGVPLECQGCLRVFTWPVRQRTLLLLARDERELARLDDADEHEVVLAAAPLEARGLVEDELLLTLPYVPRCGDGQCAAVAPGPAAPLPRASAPFAALADLQLGVAGKPKGGN
jgi:uncharacterized protein